MRLLAAALWILWSVFAPLPALGDTKTPDYPAIVRAVMAAEKPAYVEFEKFARDLAESVGNYCDASDKRELKPVHRAFHAALDRWQRIEHVRSGPAAELDAHPRLNFWPDPRSRVAKHMRRLVYGNAPLDSVPLARRSVAVQGFPALEFLLFGEGALSSGSDERSCIVAAAIGRNVAAVAAALNERWGNGAYTALSAKERVGRWFNDLLAGLQALSDLKLAGPLGEKTGRVKPAFAENEPSGRALRNLVANLAGLEGFYIAISDGARGKLAGTEEDRLVRFGFASLRKTAAALPESFAAAVEDEKALSALWKLVRGIRELRGMIVSVVAPALGLVEGFNSFDGD